MASIAWGVFDWVHRIVAYGARYVGAGVQMARQMWEASPVSAGILVAGGLLAVMLAIFLIRLIIRFVRRILRGLACLGKGMARLAALPGGPVSRFRQFRRIRRRMRRVPEKAVAEYAIVARECDVPITARLARHTPRGTLFDDHLRAVNALLLLQTSLPERSCLKGEAIILGQLYSHLPVLAEYLVSQMDALAVIQRAAGGHSLNHKEMRYPALIDEAKRARRQLEEITQMMPMLVDRALVQPHLESMSRKTLDLESLRDTIRQLLDVGRK